MTNVKLTKGTPNKYYGTDADNNLVPMADPLTSGLTLGNTETTAYRGDYGETAYNHSQSAHAPDNMNDLAIAYAIAL